MSFFYNLNKKMADLAKKQDAKQIAEEAKATAPKSRLAESMDIAERSTGNYSAKSARAGKDIGKPGKNFAKIAKTSGGGEKGQRIAGAVLNKLRGKTEGVEESTLAGHTRKYGVVIVGHNDGKPVKMFDKESDAKAYADKGIRVGGGLKQGSVRTIVAPKNKNEGVDKEAFAKLAPPTDKITFADKIAGAKKEVDEMLGDVAAEAMKAAIGKGKQQVADEGNAFTGKLKATPKGGKFTLGKKDFTDTSEVDEGYAEMDAWLKSREKEKGTGKFDKKKISTGTVYTRKHEDDKEDDETASGKDSAPKKRGRPQGKPKGPERVTAKSYKYKGGRPEKTAEDLDTDGVMMTRPSNMSSESAGDDTSAVKAAIALLKKQGYKISKSEEELDEKAVSKKQQKFMGMVHATQKGEKAPSKEVAKVAKEMPKKAATDFASTKHKGLPEKVKAKKEVEVEETASEPKEKKAKGGYNFGGGIYEGFNNTVEGMITESMSVNVSVDDQGKKSISVNATDADAEALAELLKMAGLGGQSAEQEVCGVCGSAECSCNQEEVVDENSPDWPTNTQTSDDSLQYSGGLNKPKSTGQTTTPVIASQLRRQVSMEENVELERSLFKTWKNYKG